MTTPQHISTNQQSAAARNRLLVIQLVRRHQQLSRRQLARLTGLRESTLSNIVRELLQNGMFEKAGKAISNTAGQKQILVQINPQRGWSVGVSLEFGVAEMIFVDAAGQTIGQTSTPMSYDLQALPLTLDHAIKQWLVDHGRPPGKMLGIGVGVPGIVNHQQGHVLHAARFDAIDVPLGQLMQKQFPDTKIVVDHNSHLATLAEVWCGAAQTLSSFLYLTINARQAQRGHVPYSYSVSLYSGQQVHRGAFHAAGELGAPLRPDIKTTLTAKDVASLANPDATLSAKFNTIIDALSDCLTPLLELIDPDATVIGGNLSWANRSFIEQLAAQCQKRLIHVPGRTVSIIPSALNQQAVAIGAALSVTEAQLCEGTDISLNQIPLTHALVDVE